MSETLPVVHSQEKTVNTNYKVLFVRHHSTAKILFLARVLFSQLLNSGVLSTCWVVQNLANAVQKMWWVFVVLSFDLGGGGNLFYFSEIGKVKGGIFPPHLTINLQKHLSSLAVNSWRCPVAVKSSPPHWYGWLCQPHNSTQCLFYFSWKTDVRKWS